MKHGWCGGTKRVRDHGFKSRDFSILTSEFGCIMMPICGQRLLSTPTLTGF